MSPQAVVSLLDSEHTSRVEAIWAELESRFGLRAIYCTYPHFTWQLAESYDGEAVTRMLRSVAERIPTFSVRAEGVALFSGPRPVLYLPVVCDARLAALHADVFRAAVVVGRGAAPYYRPRRWVPHITLAIDDLTPKLVPDVMALLADREIHWEINIDNLALVPDVTDRSVPWVRYSLQPEPTSS